MNEKEISQLNFSGWPLPDEYLQEIGRITTLWSSLELLLNFVLGKLAGFDDLKDPRPFILFSHTTFPQKLDSFGALCEHLLDRHPYLANYKGVISKLRMAQSSRNKFAHNAPAYNPETNTFQMGHASARGTLKTFIENIEITHIKAVTVEIIEAQTDLYELIFKRKLPPPWNKKVNP